MINKFLNIFNFKENKKRAIIATVIVLIVIVTLFFVIILRKPLRPDKVILPEDLQPGTEGEVQEGKKIEDINPEAATAPVRPLEYGTPAVISDTKGVILSIERRSLKIQGSGENFEDQIKRTLTVEFTENTITTKRGAVDMYLGFDGLRFLKVGDTILVSSSENIRGKTSFSVDYVNEL